MNLDNRVIEWKVIYISRRFYLTLQAKYDLQVDNT